MAIIIWGIFEDVGCVCNIGVVSNTGKTVSDFFLFIYSVYLSVDTIIVFLVVLVLCSFYSITSYNW